MKGWHLDFALLSNLKMLFFFILVIYASPIGLLDGADDCQLFE